MTVLRARSTGKVIRMSVEEGRAPMDLDKAAREFDEDRDFVKELAAGFVDRVGEQVRIIRTALEEGDAHAVRREAHSIKGGAANICAYKLSAAARDLESAGKSGSLDKAFGIFRILEEEFRRLADYARNEL